MQAVNAAETPTTKPNTLDNSIEGFYLRLKVTGPISLNDFLFRRPAGAGMCQRTLSSDHKGLNWGSSALRDYTELANSSCEDQAAGISKNLPKRRYLHTSAKPESSHKVSLDSCDTSCCRGASPQSWSTCSPTSTNRIV